MIKDTTAIVTATETTMLMMIIMKNDKLYKTTDSCLTVNRNIGNNGYMCDTMFDTTTDSFRQFVIIDP